tara:strand:- start:17 stop:328 length:312 start_codon:yes stop_codon:yes gene_type:complete
VHDIFEFGMTCHDLLNVTDVVTWFSPIIFAFTHAMIKNLYQMPEAYASPSRLSFRGHFKPEPILHRGAMDALFVPCLYHQPRPTVRTLSLRQAPPINGYCHGQ